MEHDEMTEAEQYEIDCDIAKFSCSTSIKDLKRLVTSDPHTFIPDIYYFEAMSRDLKAIADNLKSLEKRAA